MALTKKIYGVCVAAMISLTSFGQAPQGIFLDDFQAKAIANPSFETFEKPSKSPTCTVDVDLSNVITPVSKYLFGNNANVYMTQMVDQPALLDHIKTLSPNLIRFPGGNISSVYFWNAEKNQPPADAPAKITDANGVLQDAGYWYGKNAEGWTLSVDNYYEMLEQTNSTGIITINYGYARYGSSADPVAAAAHLAAEWVRYDNGRTKFWEIGNESNGAWQAGYRINKAVNQDGQPEIVTGATYGNHFKVFADSMRKAATEKGATIYLGAQLLAEAPASWWTDTDKNWNTQVFQQSANTPDFYIIHSYYTPFATNSTASEILATAATVTTDMMNFVKNAVSTAGVTPKPLALTEWNIFAEKSKQQVSYINGMHAAIVLGELIKNKYGQASRWDLANGWNNGDDHGMFSQGDEPGGIPKWNPRPAYYYMYYFQKYFGDHMVGTSLSGNGSSDVVTYASTFDSGQAGIVVVNKGTAEQTVRINLQDFGYGERFYWYTLTGGTDNGEFSLKVNVNGRGPTLSAGGPANVASIPARAALIGEGVKIMAPARSVTYVLVENGDNVITAADPESAQQVKVYPNPATSKVKIDLPSGGFSRIEITDVNGKQILNSGIDTRQVSFEVNTSLSPGVYFVRLVKGGSVIQTKIIMK